MFERLVSAHPGWEIRKRACGVYNCFGHVWASRRTAVYEESEVERILADDGYRVLASAETPLQGDLALYALVAGGDLLHVGLVVELRRISSSGGSPLGHGAPWVLSKWNDVSGEVVHHVNDVPFPADEFSVAFWTDRPRGSA